jgi:hypothetical protein
MSEGRVALGATLWLRLLLPGRKSGGWSWLDLIIFMRPEVCARSHFSR